MSTIDDCRIVQLPKIHNPAGNLTAINSMHDVSFEIKRVYYLYDVPGGESRGGHAHWGLHQLIVAAGGSFEVILNDGRASKSVYLNQPYTGLIIIPGIWRELVNFSSGSTCLVLASLLYDENDYIRDFDHFKTLKAK